MPNKKVLVPLFLYDKVLYMVGINKSCINIKDLSSMVEWHGNLRPALMKRWRDCGRGG